MILILLFTLDLKSSAIPLQLLSFLRCTSSQACASTCQYNPGFVGSIPMCPCPSNHNLSSRTVRQGLTAETGKRAEVPRGYYALQPRLLSRGTCQVNQDLSSCCDSGSLRQRRGQLALTPARNRRPKKKAATRDPYLTP